MPQCVHCNRSIAQNEEACPHCGGEQPVEWMVKLVYVLAFLFIQGVIYRLVWPQAESMVLYAAYFAVTSAIALLALFFLRKRDQSSQ